MKSVLMVGVFILLVGCDYSSVEKDSALTEITIGKQKWMHKNLAVETFRNGDSIPRAKTDKEWRKAAYYKTPAWRYYDDDSENGKRYGKLYNWYSVTDPRGLAPEGWHVPTKEEWDELFNFLGGSPVAGSKMKAEEFWMDYDIPDNPPVDFFAQTKGTNESGFSGFPGGFCSNYGVFAFNEVWGAWWSSSEFDDNHAHFVLLAYNSSYATISRDKKESGFSVRCLKN